MSRTIARLLLCILLMPLMAVTYIASMVTCWEVVGYGTDVAVHAIAGLITAAVSFGYWFMVWRSVVQWTGQRIARTALAGLAAAVGGVALGTVVEFGLMGDGFGVFLGSSLALLGWLIASVFIWRETAVERAARLAKLGAGSVSCPACGYNLTGLRATTCPECGAVFSIQELVAAARGIGELDTPG